MRQTFVLLGALAMLVAQPLVAAPLVQAKSAAPLPPGKPSGVKPAQTGDLLPIYGGVVLFGALLAVTIGISGSSVPPNTATTGTTFCCG
jgi:hypothetical protein